MTDLALQKDIIDELKNFFEKDEIMMIRGKEFAEMHVYQQDLPIKDEEDDEELRNYVLVVVGDQDVEGDEWVTEVHFAINIEDRDRDRSGNINVLYIMNEIYNHFMKKGIVGKHCRMDKKAHKRLNMDAFYPYYEGDLITTWRLPLAQEEGLEEFV